MRSSDGVSTAMTQSRRQSGLAIARPLSCPSHDSTGPIACPQSLYKLVPLNVIPRFDARFYEKDDEQSLRYIACRPEREAYYEAHGAIVLGMFCIDEREQNTFQMLGLPPGAANPVEIAGCRTDESNLPLAQYLQQKVTKAAKDGKLVLILIVTHQSEAFPTTDSCAEWEHDATKADAHATEQVLSFNDSGGDRDPEGRIARRYRIAVHLISYTDSEARVWVGVNGARVDPRDFVDIPGRPCPEGICWIGSKLDVEVYNRFIQAFPRVDSRFEGVTTEQYYGLIRQMSEMCTHNIREMRKKFSKPHHVIKNGHKGRRILLGRGWDMYVAADLYFKIGDLIPRHKIVKQLLIAVRFVVRNCLRNGRKRAVVPIHINGLYNSDEEGDRSGTIRYVVGLAKKVQNFVQSLCQNPAYRKVFDREVKRALAQTGMKWSDVSPEARRYYREELLDAFRVYASVSARKTRKLELVAVMNQG